MSKLGNELLDAAKPGLRLIAKDVLVGLLYDKGLDAIKKLIPGQWDDSLIEGFRPQGKKALEDMVAKL